MTGAAKRRSGPAAVLRRYRTAVNARPWRSLVLGGAVTVVWAVIVGLVFGTHPHATGARVAEVVLIAPVAIFGLLYPVSVAYANPPRIGWRALRRR